MRNVNSSAIAWIIGGSVGAVTLLLLIGFNLISDTQIAPVYITLAVLVVVGFTTTLTFFMIKAIVQRKLNLLFRIIHGGRALAEREEDLDYDDARKEAAKFATESRREIEQLKEQAEYRKEFIGNLAHELKTPLFTVQGFLHTLLEGGLEDESINRKYLQKADKNLDRITLLVEDLDQISKLESRSEQLELEKIDLAQLIEEVLDDLTLKAEKHGVKLNFEKPKSACYAMVDRSKINQVITNLIINSINYSEDEGETNISLISVDRNYLIEISDNGIGISEEDLPRIFERFFRVERSRDRHKGGSGLGLAIVKHIVEAHSGTIAVRSIKDLGSTFSLTLAKA